MTREKLAEMWMESFSLCHHSLLTFMLFSSRLSNLSVSTDDFSTVFAFLLGKMVELLFFIVAVNVTMLLNQEHN